MAEKVQGNNPVLWSKFLSVLDERMQFGLLTHLRRCGGYHFETETLYIEASLPADMEYLSKDTVLQQLNLLAADIDVAKKVIVRKS